MKSRRVLFSPLLYFILSSIWIIFSDTILLALIKDAAQLTFVQSVKGIVFVLFSAVFFFGQQVTKETMSNEARLVLQSRSNQIQGLRKIDLAILSSQNLDEIVSLVVDQIYGQLDPQALRIHLRNEASGQFELKVSEGEMPPLPVADLSAADGWDTLDTQIISLETGMNGHQEPPLHLITPLIGRQKVLGMIEALINPGAGLMREWVEYFEAAAGQLAIAIEQVQIIEQYEAVNREMHDAQKLLLKGWAKALEFKDRETKGHCDRVTDLTRRMGAAMGLSQGAVEGMIRGAYLHDIGKMAIPDHILFKKGPLTDEEWSLMKKHPLYAQEFLDGIGFLDEAMMIPLYHHERWDGSGYPFGLQGEAIPLQARIFAIVDVWDALTHDRPYRPAWRPDEVRAYLQRLAGEKFDPQLVEEFLGIMVPEVSI